MRKKEVQVVVFEKFFWVKNGVCRLLQEEVEPRLPTPDSLLDLTGPRSPNTCSKCSRYRTRWCMCMHAHTHTHSGCVLRVRVNTSCSHVGCLLCRQSHNDPLLTKGHDMEKVAINTFSQRLSSVCVCTSTACVCVCVSDSEQL